MENEQVEWKMNENLSTSSKCKASGVIGSFIGMGMVGFCFGIGLILAWAHWGCYSCGGDRWSWLLHLSNQERTSEPRITK